MTFFYFVRHGQTLGNIEGLSQGTVDTEVTYLNETGRQQVQNLHDHFDIGFADRIITSPLMRTQQTTEILNSSVQLPVEVDSRLKEISYGDWDGTRKSVLKKDYPDLFSPISGDVTPDYYTVAHGESFAAVEARVADFITETTEKYPDDKIIIVTHGFTVRSFVVNALQVANPYSIPEPENASVTKISVMPSGQQILEFFNRNYQE